MDGLAHDDAVAFLQKTNSSNGMSIYEHLASVLLKVLPGPKTGVKSAELTLEDAVAFLQKANATSDKSIYAHRAKVLPKDTADAAQVLCKLKLYGNPELPIDPETGEPVEAEAPNEYEAEDIMRDAGMFDAVGGGLPAQEMYSVLLAAKSLGESPTKQVQLLELAFRVLQTVRFFGKVFGLYADYYIFETTLKEYPEEPEEQLEEGQVPKEVQAGANGYVYFVCNALGGPFVQLPDVTPAQIKAARSIKKYMTGRLDADVSTFPMFPGKEAEFLRAQIARIACSCVLCPANVFVVSEEGGLEKAEEFEPLPAREMGTTENWCHRYPHLKKQGRCDLHVREPPEDEDAEFEPTEEEQEEGPELLAPVSNDDPVGGGAPPEGEDAGEEEGDGSAAWTALFSSCSESVQFQIAGMRSNRWPGALAVCNGSGAFSNIYVGWAQKNTPFIPLPPPPIAEEFDQSMLESADLPPKPAPPAEEAEAEE